MFRSYRFWRACLPLQEHMGRLLLALLFTFFCQWNLLSVNMMCTSIGYSEKKKKKRERASTQCLFQSPFILQELSCPKES